MSADRVTREKLDTGDSSQLSGRDTEEHLLRQKPEQQVQRR
jgi:hypothetical protein